MIFIAVALFAALAYAFMRSSQTSTSMITNEQAKSHAIKLVGYGNDLRTAVTRLKLKGCSDNQINFANPVLKWSNGTLINPSSSGAGFNPNAPADGRCNVFGSAGGLSPIMMPEITDGINQNNAIAGTPFFVLTQVQGVGTSAPELALWLQGIPPQICHEISKLVGTGDLAPVDSNNNWAMYYGDYSLTDYSVYGEESALLVGKQNFCARQTSASTGTYTHVLYPR